MSVVLKIYEYIVKKERLLHMFILLLRRTEINVGDNNITLDKNNIDVFIIYFSFYQIRFHISLIKQCTNVLSPLRIILGKKYYQTRQVTSRSQYFTWV